MLSLIGVVKVAFERQSSGDIQMVAYPEGHGRTEPSCRTTKIDNYSLKASTGKSIHVGETSILSKGVGKSVRIVEMSMRGFSLVESVLG